MLADNLYQINSSSTIILTDGGIETSLIFLDGFELPFFSAFDLLKNEEGFNGLKNYYRRYLKIAADFDTPFIMESPTWRANPDWIKKAGYPEETLFDINKKAIDLMLELKEEFSASIKNIYISGCVGPRGDGYTPENKMSIDEAEKYHSHQVEVFSKLHVDIVTAVTMNYMEEAAGIAAAAEASNTPAVISFTVETDGTLPDGTKLKDTVERTDQSVNLKPLYYMINCAHPSHFIIELKKYKDEEWIKRLRGVRANASDKSHAELNESSELETGNPEEFGVEHKKLKALFRNLNVFGGCCGTDERHIREIAKNLVPFNTEA